MSAGGDSLLRALGSGVRPVDAPRGGAAPTGKDADAFTALLEAARSGDVRTGLPVSLAPGVNLKLSASEAARLSDAADRAAGAGARTAAVLLDQRVLTLDAQERRVTGVRSAGTLDTLTGIDAIVRAGPAERGTNARGAPVAKTGTPGANPGTPGGGTGGSAGSALLAALAGRAHIGRS